MSETCRAGSEYQIFFSPFEMFTYSLMYTSIIACDGEGKKVILKT